MLFWPSVALVVVAVIVAVTITLRRSMEMQHQLNLAKVEMARIEAERLARSADKVSEDERAKTVVAYNYGIEQARFGTRVLDLVADGKWPEDQMGQIGPAIVRQLDGEFPPRPPRRMSGYGGVDLLVSDEMRSM